jgi:UDP-glucuronate decarboxylase
MNLLITGGTGFFGRALIKYLEAKRLGGDKLPFEQVTILSRAPEQFCFRFPALANLPWIRWHTGNVLSPASLPQHDGFDYILHAAGDSTDAAGLTLLQKYRQIVDGTENILKFAATRGTRRFLLTSSGGAYGPQPADMNTIPETYTGMPDPLSPSNAYGVAKRQAEHLCALYGEQHSIEWVVARCFAFVGEDLPLNAHFAIGNFVRDALWRDEITVAGDGTALRSYLDQSDLAQWLTTLLERGQSGEAYNVGSDQAISIADLAAVVRDTLSPDKPIRILGTPDVRRSRHMYVPNTAKAQRSLGLRAWTSLIESIHNTAQAARSRSEAEA